MTEVRIRGSVRGSIHSSTEGGMTMRRSPEGGIEATPKKWSRAKLRAAFASPEQVSMWQAQEQFRVFAKRPTRRRMARELFLHLCFDPNSRFYRATDPAIERGCILSFTEDVEWLNRLMPPADLEHILIDAACKIYMHGGVEKVLRVLSYSKTRMLSSALVEAVQKAIPRMINGRTQKERAAVLGPLYVTIKP